MARTLVMVIEVDEGKTEITDPMGLMVEFMKVLDGREDAPGVFIGPPGWSTFNMSMEEVDRALCKVLLEPVEVPQGVVEEPARVDLPQFSLPPGPVFLKDLW